MSLTQNEKIRQVTENTIIIGVDIASETHWARAFDWRGIELGKVNSFENNQGGFGEFHHWAETQRIISSLEPSRPGIIGSDLPHG